MYVLSCFEILAFFFFVSEKKRKKKVIVNVVFFLYNITKDKNNKQ